MSRHLPAVLAGACVALGALNLVVYNYGRRELLPPDEPRTAWDRWQMLDVGERAQLIHLYQRYAGRADAREVFRRADAFADLPREAQDRLRRLCRKFYEIADELPASQQREMLRLPPEARAVFMYWHLRSMDPTRLEQLRESVPAVTSQASPVPRVR